MVYCSHIRCSVPMLRWAGSRGLVPNGSLGHVVHYIGCWSYYLVLYLNLNSEKEASWDSARDSSQQGDIPHGERWCGFREIMRTSSCVTNTQSESHKNRDRGRQASLLSCFGPHWTHLICSVSSEGLVNVMAQSDRRISYPVKKILSRD